MTRPWPWVVAALASCSTPERPSAAPEVVGPAPLRRLTNTQYNHVLFDVFHEQVELPEFPSDTVIGGFDNAAEGQTPADLRIARYQSAAQTWAEVMTKDDEHVARVTGCPEWASAAAEVACIQSFFDGTVRRLFRRPLTHDERERLFSAWANWREVIDFEGALQLSLESVLQAPQFLYRAESAETFDDYARATRLAMLLWDSGPDDLLLDAAAQGQLGTVEQIRAQATRLLEDDRFKRTVWSFHRQWLGLDRVMLDEGVTRSAEVDASWSTQTQAAVLDESRRFVENTLASRHTLSALFTSTDAWLDGESARLYGVDAPTVAGAQSSLPSSERAGILTRLAFLAGTSHPGATSPPIRGNAINLKLFCRMPNPPPAGIDTSVPQQVEGQVQTNRSLFEARTSPPACAGCHRTLNGLGFGLENYSAAGTFHDTEFGLPIDSSGALYGTDVDGTFVGAIDLSERLARSTLVHGCAANMWVRYTLGRAPTDEESAWADGVAKHFYEQGGDLHALLLEVVSSPTFMRFVEAEK